MPALLGEGRDLETQIEDAAQQDAGVGRRSVEGDAILGPSVDAHGADNARQALELLFEVRPIVLQVQTKGGVSFVADKQVIHRPAVFNTAYVDDCDAVAEL